MAAINFPASPAPGDTFTAAGVTWTWDGSKWTGNGLSQSYLPLAGGTMNGPLTLVGNPVGVLDAAPKQYVDAQSLYPHDNRIINGDMRIDQRNNGATGTLGGYTIDRWGFASSQTGKGTWGRNLSGSGTAMGFPYSLGFTSASAYASIAADNFSFYQVIEADNISDFCWGTANAQPVTLSFWVYSNQTGTFSGTIRNAPSPPTRSYPFTFNIPVANTWTKIIVTIPGDTGGTWIMNGNAGGIQIVFDLGCGSNNRGPAGAWASANYVGATGGQSIVATNGATFFFTGVKLEIGSVATPFNRQSFAKSMVDCQRYYQQLGNGASNTIGIQGYAGAVGPLFSCSIGYQTMRAAPTAVAVGTFSSANTGPINLYGGLQTMLLQVGPPAVGGFSYYNTGASSYIALTAEL